MHPTVQCTHVHKILVKYTLNQYNISQYCQQELWCRFACTASGFLREKINKRRRGPLSSLYPYIFFVSDSAVWCTPQSLTPRYDAHSRNRLRSGMHTKKFFYNSNVLAKSKEFENTLACLSVVQMGSNREKLEVNHRIKDDRMENCVAYIGFISK